MDPKQKLPGLYDPRFEHDNCGIGAVANIKGIKTHKTVDQALHIVEHLEHRAGKDAEGKTGDGVGILLQISQTNNSCDLQRQLLIIRKYIRTDQLYDFHQCTFLI